MSASNLVFFHWGDSFDSHEAYIDSIKNSPWIVAPYAEKKRWLSNLFSKLPKNVTAYCPEFPCKQNAKYAEWKIVADMLMSNLQGETVFIGHSLGGNFLAKYFSENDHHAKAFHFISPCFGSPGGFELTDVDVSNLSKKADSVHLWYSVDDPIVSVDHFERYKKAIPNAVIHEFQDRAHFNQESFPEMEEKIMEELQ